MLPSHFDCSFANCHVNDVLLNVVLDDLLFDWTDPLSTHLRLNRACSGIFGEKFPLPHGR